MFGFLRRLIGRGGPPTGGKTVRVHVKWLNFTSLVIAKTDVDGNPVTIGPKWTGSTFRTNRPWPLPISCWGSSWPTHRITKVRAAQREIEFDPATVKCEQKGDTITLTLPTAAP